MNSFEKHPILTISTIIIIFIIIVDLVSGLFFIKKDYHSFRTKHYYYHHGVLPNKASYTLWTLEPYKFYSNSFALRDDAIKKVPLQTSKKRILFMGDSHTEGVGLNFEETFTGICRSLVDTSKIEILNGACVSYSPKIEFLKTKYLIEKQGLKVDEIFLFIDISDIQNELVYEKFEPRDFNFLNDLVYKTGTWLRHHSMIFYSVSKWKEKTEQMRFYDTMLKFDKHRTDNSSFSAAEQLYASFFDKFDDKTLLSNPQFHGVGDWMYSKEFKPLALKGIKLGQENAKKLADLCKRHQIKLTISVHPWFQQIEKGDTTDEYTASWESFARKHNLGFINFYPLFMSNDPFNTCKQYYFEGDNHWNAEGNKLVAKKLMEYIR